MVGRSQGEYWEEGFCGVFFSLHTYFQELVILDFSLLGDQTLPATYPALSGRPLYFPAGRQR